ncbi:MAG: DUF6326 family protein [Candidatus Kariarchaeaceae archaeon]|jgi:hypothetical protein
MLEELSANDPDVNITEEILLLVGIVISIPIFMRYFSLSLENKLNRRLNVILGGFFVIWDLSFLIVVFYSLDPAYEIFHGFVHLILTVLIFQNAWK